MNEIDIDKMERSFSNTEEVLYDVIATLTALPVVHLLNGRKGYFKKLSSPQIDDETRRYRAGFDFIFDDNGSPDHLEFYIHHTGGGGMINE